MAEMDLLTQADLQRETYCNRIGVITMNQVLDHIIRDLSSPTSRMHEFGAIDCRNPDFQNSQTQYMQHEFPRGADEIFYRGIKLGGSWHLLDVMLTPVCTFQVTKESTLENEPCLTQENEYTLQHIRTACGRDVTTLCKFFIMLDLLHKTGHSDHLIHFPLYESFFVRVTHHLESGGGPLLSKYPNSVLLVRVNKTNVLLQSDILPETFPHNVYESIFHYEDELKFQKFHRAVTIENTKRYKEVDGITAERKFAFTHRTGVLVTEAGPVVDASGIWGYENHEIFDEFRVQPLLLSISNDSFPKPSNVVASYPSPNEDPYSTDMPVPGATAAVETQSVPPRRKRKASLNETETYSSFEPAPCDFMTLNQVMANSQLVKPEPILNAGNHFGELLSLEEMPFDSAAIKEENTGSPNRCIWKPIPVRGSIKLEKSDDPYADVHEYRPNPANSYIKLENSVNVHEYRPIPATSNGYIKLENSDEPDANVDEYRPIPANKSIKLEKSSEPDAEVHEYRPIPVNKSIKLEKSNEPDAEVHEYRPIPANKSIKLEKSNEPDAEVHEYRPIPGNSSIKLENSDILTLEHSEITATMNQYEYRVLPLNQTHAILKLEDEEATYQLIDLKNPIVSKLPAIPEERDAKATNMYHFIVRHARSQIAAFAASGQKGKPRMVCPINDCPKVYITLNGMKYHAKEVHCKEGDSLRCVCGSAFMTTHGYVRHVNKCKKESPIMTCLCEKIFTTSQGYARHRKTCKQNPHESTLPVSNDQLAEPMKRISKPTAGVPETAFKYL